MESDFYMLLFNHIPIHIHHSSIVDLGLVGRLEGHELLEVEMVQRQQRQRPWRRGEGQRTKTQMILRLNIFVF